MVSNLFILSSQRIPDQRRAWGSTVANKMRICYSSLVRRCLVSVIGKDGERHSIDTDGISLFDAAYKAKQQWAMFWWFPPDAVIEVRSGNDCWQVGQDRLRVWATGNMRRRRREF